MKAEHSMIMAGFVEPHGGAFEVKFATVAVALEDGAPLANASRKITLETHLYRIGKCVNVNKVLKLIKRTSGVMYNGATAYKAALREFARAQQPRPAGIPY